MITSVYSIAFSIRLEHSAFIVPLTAHVELHHSPVFYIVKNFKTCPDQKSSILPDLKIRKVRGRWVHCDSEKETELSLVVGKAIDDHQTGQVP
jgi:hypothetical protein